MSEVGGARGYDGGRKFSGCKWHILEDSMGLLLAVLVTAAPQVLRRLTPEH